MSKNINLSNIGLKRLFAIRKKDVAYLEDEKNLLETLFQSRCLSFDSQYEALVNRGYAELCEKNQEELFLHYQYPFLENVKRVHFEITTSCNFNCAHCRSGKVYRQTEQDIKNLFPIAKLFVELGIKRFDFIGGEISLYGDNWLELVRYIKSLDSKVAITLYTNGWFLDKKNFTINDTTFANDSQYFSHLKYNGVTHILFSIDGPEQVHDTIRHHSGLYKRVLNCIERVKKEGLEPRLSLVIRKGENIFHLAQFAKRIYGIDGKSDEYMVKMIRQDSYNHLSNFIDINNGSSLRTGTHSVEQAKKLGKNLKCKAFYRPSPTIRVRASGVLGICPLMNEDELYGGISNESFIQTLNSANQSFSYKLHANDLLMDYVDLLDKKVLDKFDHLCTLRIALHKLALQLKHMGIEKASLATKADIKIANQKIAQWL